MKTIFFSIIAFFSLSLQAQEQFLTSHFNWSPRTATLQKEIFYFNPETKAKEWSKTEVYTFYNQYLDSVVVDLGDAKEITKYNFNIDNSLVSKITDYKLSETQDKTLFFYDKELRLTKSQEFVQGRLFSETKYSYDKQNRLIKQMPLQACPTIKYAMQDFTITRIYEKYLSNASPYNTYRVKGLPPGPICTPAAKTIDLVLDAPKTDYIYFVAKADFSGYHHFSNNYAEHDRYAKEYQKKLDEYQAKKAQEKNP